MRVILAFAAAALMSAPALSAPQASQISVHVRTSDLNLATKAGQRALDGRLAMAVVAVCGMPADFSAQESNELSACRADVLKSAQGQVQSAKSRLPVAVAAVSGR